MFVLSTLVTLLGFQVMFPLSVEEPQQKLSPIYELKGKDAKTAAKIYRTFSPHKFVDLESKNSHYLYPLTIYVRLGYHRPAVIDVALDFIPERKALLRAGYYGPVREDDTRKVYGVRYFLVYPTVTVGRERSGTLVIGKQTYVLPTTNRCGRIATDKRVSESSWLQMFIPGPKTHAAEVVIIEAIFESPKDGTYQRGEIVRSIQLKPLKKGYRKI